MITSSKRLKLLCQNQLHPLLVVSCCVLLEFHLSSFFFLLISSLFQPDVMKQKKEATEENTSAGASRFCPRWLMTLFLLETDDM